MAASSSALFGLKTSGIRSKGRDAERCRKYVSILVWMQSGLVLVRHTVEKIVTLPKVNS